MCILHNAISSIPHCSLIKGTRILVVLLSFVVVEEQQRQSSKGVLVGFHNLSPPRNHQIGSRSN
jgi:hypothetical protein